MSRTPQFFTTVGYLHDPERNMDRIAVGTTGSLDEYPTLQLSGPDLGTYTFESTDALDMRRSVLEAVATDARDLADGEAVDAYVMLSSAVDAFLAGATADEIHNAAHPAIVRPTWDTVVDALKAQGLDASHESTGGGCWAVFVHLPGRLYMMLTASDGPLMQDREDEISATRPLSTEQPGATWHGGLYDDGEAMESEHTFPGLLCTRPEDDAKLADAVATLIRSRIAGK